MKTISQKAQTQRYLFALILIAALSITSNLVLTKVLETHANAATIINISGRQRMLSQRIASFALQYALLEDPAARSDLRASAAEMDGNLLVLGAYDVANNLSQDPKVHALYYTGPDALSIAVPAYIGLARAIAAAPPGDKALTPQLKTLLAQARAPLLNQLNAMTAERVRLYDLELRKMRHLETMSLLLVLATLAFEAIWIFRPMVRRIVEKTEALNRLTVTDPLTEVHNRRGFLWRADIELKRAARYGQAVTVLIVDIDHFKHINDNHGHESGDLVLKKLGQLFLQCFRTTDIIGRWGGEEFAVLLPATAIGPGLSLAQRMCAQVANTPFDLGNVTLHLTISMGVAEVEAGLLSLDDAMRRADAALYDAKNNGRNRVEAAVKSTTAEPVTAS